MEIHFTKTNGAGNDFVVIDNRDGRYDALDRKAIALLCDRHRGIGADGLLAVEKSSSDADFRFRYYNADGGEAEMCGNGARCFARFARPLLGDKVAAMTFDSIAGRISATFIEDNVCIQLSQPKDLQLNRQLIVNDSPLTIHSIDTGVPHAIEIVEELENIDIRRRGAALRHHKAFSPKGTNVNFQLVTGPGRIRIRTYERGVEDETLACGTGVVANAIIHHELTTAPSPIHVEVRGGETMVVAFDKDATGNYHNVTLTGPADITFTGTFTLPR